MRILFKIPSYISKSRRLNLDVDLSFSVGEIRSRISRIIGASLSTFQLVTSRFGQTVLLTDSWTLSFFISEENTVIKIKMLETTTCRRESLVSPIISSLSMVNTASSGQELFMTCCKVGNITKIKEIISSVDDQEFFNYVEDNKWGALHYTCLAGHSDIVNILVQKKVNCNKVTIDEWTPLQLASFFGRTECIKILLDHPNLQLNKITKFRGTALHLACETGQLDIVKLLLEKNACVTLEDHRKRKIADLCKNNQIREMISSASQKGVNEDDFQTPFCSEVYMMISFSLNVR